MSQDKSNDSSLRDKLILIVFGLSGLTALVYEIIWIRPLSLVFGTTTYAVSIIIAAFLSGLALGSWIAGRFSDKVENPLKIYGFIEIGIYIVSEKQVPYVKTPLNTDDRPVLEFSTAFNLYDKNPVPLFEKFKDWSLNN